MLPYRHIAFALTGSLLVACGSSSSSAPDGTAGSGGSAGASGAGASSAGASGAGAGGAGASGGAGAGATGGSGGQSAASCGIPADANSCISGGASPSCQSFWGEYTADIVKQSCPAPNTFQAGPCSTQGIVAMCVYPAPGPHSLLIPTSTDAASQAALKGQCEKGGASWCVL